MSFVEKYILEPLRYTTSDWLKVVIGGLLLFFNLTLDWTLSLLLGPFSIIPTIIIDLVVSIVIMGYYIGVIKNTLEGLDILPDWSNIGEILIDGALCVGALLILLLVIYLPLILLLAMGNLSFQWIMVALLYILVVLIALMIYTPLATVNLVKKGFFGFFDFEEVFKKISPEYLGIIALYTLWEIGIVVVFYLMATISLFVFFLILPLGILCFLLSTLVISVIIFGLWIMFSRAIAKYYLEKELRG